jgi:hypothetical protein
MGLDTHMIAGRRACSASIRSTHPTITNETSPHYAEALAGIRRRRATQAPFSRLHGVPAGIQELPCNPLLRGELDRPWDSRLFP